MSAPAGIGWPADPEPSPDAQPRDRQSIEVRSPAGADSVGSRDDTPPAPPGTESGPKRRPTTGWRKVIYVLTGGAINPGSPRQSAAAAS
ncbi:MAG: hypothetical protein WKF47_17695 [Geodermatophilaceae bacterium]